MRRFISRLFFFGLACVEWSLRPTESTQQPVAGDPLLDEEIQRQIASARAAIRRYAPAMRELAR